MAVVAVSAKGPPARQGVRPLDPSRDLPTVVKLIELGFQEELGPQGQKMLHQMRRLARPIPVINLLSQAGTTLPGFVWEEEGHVVANLSLRRAAASQRKGWIIGNVVVHPEFRGRGIGRALMETAIDTVHLQNGRWIGLEVRVTNEVARALYKSLNFYDVGKTVHMLHHEGARWPTFTSPTRPWRAATPDDQQTWARLATSIYDRRQQKILEIYPGRYNFGGLERRLLLWLRGERERAWIDPSNNPKRAVRVRTDRRHHFHLWELLVASDQKPDEVEETVARAMTTRGSDQNWPVVTTVKDKSAVVPLLESLGFQRHRTLVQMYCSLY